MTMAEVFKQYLEHLFTGKRCQARELIFAAHDRAITASRLLKLVIWPAMEQVDKLYRANEISRLTEQMAVRINRMLADQLCGFLARKPKSGKRIVVISGKADTEELGAQITADLFEGEGWSVWFLGGRVPNDEVLEFVGKIKADLLCIYAPQPQDVPNIRNLIALIRSVGVCQEMQILACGGVFNRAPGLAEEIRADLYAPSAADALKSIEAHPVRIPLPDVPEPGRRRKKRKRPLPAARRLRAAFRA
jgi:methanogenic corrinoid protein MtbC1